ALSGLLQSLGGEIITSHRVQSLREFADARAVLCDITPRQLAGFADARMKSGERRELEKFKYGPGVYKIDWALDAPIPWNAPGCRIAGTVHLGGTFEEIAESERAAWEGRTVDRPFVLLAQPSIFDASRAPAGKHTAWGYCHVPSGSQENVTEQIEMQVERF